MQEWMLSFVNNFGYFGIFLLIFVETVFPPIPSEAVLLFGGALTVSTGMNVPGAVLAATAGSLLGAIALYAFGRVLPAERLKKLFSGKLGRLTHIRPAHIKKAERWFRRYQGKAVLLCRCVPLVRSLISIPAGFSRMDLPRFLLFTSVGSAVWNTVLVCMGAGLGAAWEKAMPYLNQYTHVALAVLAGLSVALVLLYLHRRHRNARRREDGDPSPKNS